MKGLKLYNSAQVPVGTDVTINISSLPRNILVTCELSLDVTWGNRIPICVTVPPGMCAVEGQFQGRASYINETTLQIEHVLRTESGIYRCRIGPSSPPPVIISGVIIVGVYIFIYYRVLNHVYVCMWDCRPMSRSRSRCIFEIFSPLTTVHTVKSYISAVALDRMV